VARIVRRPGDARVSRGALWSAAALSIGTALLVFWFLNTFERVPVSRRDAPQTEARLNPYLALERFLVRMGRPATRTTEADVLLRLPLPAALILDRGRAYHLTDARHEALMDWVNRGGYLIVAPETPGTPDTIADDLELAWTETLRETDENGEPNPQARKLPPAPEQLSVNIPGATRPLTVAFLDGLTLLGSDAEWLAGDPNYGASVLHFAYGRGFISVVAHLDGLISNDTIADHDHAELVSILLQQYQPKGPVLLLTRLGVPTLGEWLATQVPLALVSSAVLLALWLWNRLPRFGNVIPEPPADRRGLHEHLLAVGRFVRRRGGGEAWLTIVRPVVEGALARRHPSYRSGGDTLEALATQAGIPLADLSRAFTGDGERADHLVSTMRALQRIERSV
jgi:hypothetical protein